MSDMKLAVMGAAGKMGRELVRAIHAMDGVTLAGAIEPPGSIALGQDAGLLAGLGKLGVEITGDALDVVAKVDGILDFTIPKATLKRRFGQCSTTKNFSRPKITALKSKRRLRF